MNKDPCPPLAGGRYNNCDAACFRPPLCSSHVAELSGLYLAAPLCRLSQLVFLDSGKFPGIDPLSCSEGLR